jgi:hypothetical protein
MEWQYEKMWKEAVVAYFNVGPLFLHMSEEIEKKTRKRSVRISNSLS